MDQNAVIALIVVGTFVIVIAMVLCLRKVDKSSNESHQAALRARMESRLRRQAEEIRRNGGYDIRDVLGPATPPLVFAQPRREDAHVGRDGGW